MHWRRAVWGEYAASLGFPMYPEMACGGEISPLKVKLGKESAAQILALLGNGMHLLTQGAFVTYVMSNVRFNKRDAEATEATGSLTKKAKLGV